MIQKMFTVIFTVFLSAGLLYASKTSTLIIEGTGDSQELLRALGKAYEELHPETSIIVPQSVGSGGGIKKVIAQKSDLGRVARELKEYEKAKGLKYLLFGYSPIVFVINADINNTNLSSQNILDILKGKITRWEEITNSGLNGKIYIVNREKGDSSRSVLNKTFEGYQDIVEPLGVTAYSNVEAIGYLTKYKNTIGYLAIGNIKNKDLKVLKIDGIEPSKYNVHKGIYKFVTPLGLVYKKNLEGTAKKFVEFLTTKKAKNIMEAYGVIPVFKDEK